MAIDGGKGCVCVCVSVCMDGGVCMYVSNRQEIKVPFLT